MGHVTPSTFSAFSSKREREPLKEVSKFHDQERFTKRNTKKETLIRIQSRTLIRFTAKKKEETNCNRTQREEERTNQSKTLIIRRRQRRRSMNKMNNNSIATIK
ncbi:hypothetical protein P4159_25375 [Bacillus thuringiensis]|uniref:hypothetical protein n=1 Tax=Bacillus thuringiensis TaxID=1428 RepID=UPI0007C1CF33|nr:hypothetical protein [Bacillus thuringiensis]AND06122.1 hypothetical protein Bt4C1_02595 [Bacillus thuringiensis serovar alesti]MED2208067.1 hypothetical protein [Bacillus thuringiensis]MED2666473.1 hypothetical protein [Bacillus thuringiensis]MED2716388.1 hypothetical protein [Bacillus thuringiensis]OTY43190.1 hypothetical protein BK745_07765 [Bacillus thuringiensis serovar alesti]